MNDAILKFMQNLDFQRLLHNAGIQPSKVLSIKVVGAEIVNPKSDVERFVEWYCERVGGKYKYDVYRMDRACEIVLNHKIKGII